MRSISQGHARSVPGLGKSEANRSKSGRNSLGIAFLSFSAASRVQPARSDSDSTTVAESDHIDAGVGAKMPSSCNRDEDRASGYAEEEDEDEEGDVDFNPFPSLEEASSSLSSELEGLECADVVESGVDTCTTLGSNSLLPRAPDDELNDYADNSEEIVMQTTVTSAVACKSSSENTSPTGCKNRKSAVIYESDNATAYEEEDGSSIAIGVVNDIASVDIGNNVSSKKLILDMDDEDAICRRTRARYSLASFTLDELETFLQETDDEDDLHNFDDEAEYRKFLAAVLQDGDGDSGAIEGNENVDEEDEDNDADFELEIEEALESDVDEIIRGESHEREYQAVGRRPETRQNKRRKASIKHKKKLSEPLNRPLRPLLPYATIAPFPPLNLRHMMIESAPHTLPSSTQTGVISIFTPHQIGQLHCLIHEHVQLLIQVFSLCVLEPSQQHIATQVQGLLSELLQNRDQLLALNRTSYPSFCFSPPYTHPSGLEKWPQILQAQSTFNSSAYDAQRVMDSFWVPFVSGPVLSVMDVAPLNLVGSYMNDVSTAVQEYKRRQLAVSCDTSSDKESLFPFQSFQSLAEANGEFSRESIPPASKRAPSSGNDQTPKKTIAAALVERTKKESVAPVPKEISKLAQRFFPLFNPTLFPHKPPPLPVANRVLFTDAEDGLLARGLMEFNIDWKQIQEHFLPCKSRHQIFVRQKNRSCSRAPENPIKAVRRMKTSPLTAEEKARIEEALKVFKLDWMSICKYIVPHRDPSLLPRQWRTAIGTQKSYKADEDKKAKRRLYESMRRNRQPADMVRGQASADKEEGSSGNACGENNSGDDCVDNEDEAYVHEAFLADWRPGTSSEPIKNVGSVGSHSQVNHEFPASLKYSQHLHTSCHSGHAESSIQINHPISNASTRSAVSKIFLRPYRARRTDSHRVVKLAPDLPPVNLPPSVRVMSQSAFKNYRDEISSKASAANQCSSGPAKEMSTPPCATNSGTSHRTEASPAEKDESDLHMHPLLFQAPENGSLPYYQLNCIRGASSSFNFFPKNHPQLNIGLFHNTQRVKQTVNCLSNSLKFRGLSTSSAGIDFHPLLQRTDDVNGDLMAAPSVGQPSSTSELLRAPLVQLQNPVDVVLTDSPMNTTSMATLAISSSPNSRANELDLDIHLSFNARKEKGEQSRSIDKQNLARSIVSTQESGIIKFQSTSNSPSHQCSSLPTLDGTGNKLDSGEHALRMSSRDVNRNNMNDIGEHSLPEIVMEQEELSDSEEEMGENVEFECEDMADSEGEGESDSDQIDNVQDKDASDASVENVVTQTDNPSNSLCLSLNSCAPPLSKAKLPVKRKGRDNGSGSGSSQSSKSTTPLQLHSDAVAVTPPSRKPRKRAQRNDSRSCIGRANKRDTASITAATKESPQSC